MKTVFSNEMVAHVWAQQNQAEGKSSNRNFYFRDATIYSYRDSWPLAKFLPETSPRVVLVNDQSYSASTSQHLRYVRQALRGLDVELVACHAADICDMRCRTNCDAIYDRIIGRHVDDLVAQAAAYAKPRKNFWRQGLDSNDASWQTVAINRMNALDTDSVARVAHLLNRPMPTVDLRAMRAAIEVAFTAYYSPERVAKRAKSYNRRNAYRFGALAHYHAWNEGVFDALPKAVLAKLPAHERNEYERVKRRDSYPKHVPVTSEQWIAGENQRSFYQDSPTLVRKRGDNLETSRGATAPFAHAVAIYGLAAKCRAEGRGYKRNGLTMHAGHFALDSIDAEGNIRIGCHKIEFAEMTRLACREIPQAVRSTYPVPAIIA